MYFADLFIWVVTMTDLFLAFNGKHLEMQAPNDFGSALHN